MRWGLPALWQDSTAHVLLAWLRSAGPTGAGLALACWQRLRCGCQPGLLLARCVRPSSSACWLAVALLPLEAPDHLLHPSLPAPAAWSSCALSSHASSGGRRARWGSSRLHGSIHVWEAPLLPPTSIPRNRTPPHHTTHIIIRPLVCRRPATRCAPTWRLRTARCARLRARLPGRRPTARWRWMLRSTWTASGQVCSGATWYWQSQRRAAAAGAGGGAEAAAAANAGGSERLCLAGSSPSHGSPLLCCA